MRTRFNHQKTYTKAERKIESITSNDRYFRCAIINTQYSILCINTARMLATTIGKPYLAIIASCGLQKSELPWSSSIICSKDGDSSDTNGKLLRVDVKGVEQRLPLLPVVQGSRPQV